jgi:hypothetical protein
MNLEFQEYRARKIVNVHRHVDGPWFWGRYSAHPYIGCRSGCEFCYVRGGRYLGRRDPDAFDTLIQVKVNAVELLRKELARLQPDVIACGDWQQPAEERYRLSRGMLQVVRDYAFPLFIVERSPRLTCDLDLLTDINQRSWVGVVLSMSSVDPALKRAFEPHSPGVKQRLQAMETLAKANILHGLLDRMPRYVAPGPLAVNRRIAERLFLKTYDLELEQADDYRIWAYRKAAWTADEWPESLADLYLARGEAGLRELPGIGKSLAAEIAGWIRDG